MPDEFPTEVGCVGTLTHAVPGGEKPGEVRVHYRGSVEHYLAHSEHVIEWTEPVGTNRQY